MYVYTGPDASALLDPDCTDTCVGAAGGEAFLPYFLS